MAAGLVSRLAGRELAAFGKSQGYLGEAVVGIATLKAAGAEERAFDRWSNLFFDHLNISLRYNYVSGSVSAILTTLPLSGQLALLWVGATQVLNGSITVGTMVALLALSTEFFAPFTSLVNSGQQFQLVSANQRDRVVEAAKFAAIHDDILAMPMGYDTFVAEGGSALSGGQRLAIARAIASKPAIILLDEATSHLDVETERKVAENLRTLACTQVIIAHRLSTVRDADTILVLDRGAIVERGDHHELLRRGGHYARLVHQQLERGQEPALEREPDAIT